MDKSVLAPFRELVAFARGGGWGSDTSQENYEPVRIIRGTDFGRLRTGRFEEVPARWEKTSKIPSRRLRPGDVVLEMAGGSATSGQTTGRSLFVDGRLLSMFNGDVVIPASFCRLVRFDETVVIPRYAYYGLQDMYISGRAREYEHQSTGLSNFQFEYFLDAELLRLPPLSEQRAISEVLGALDDKIEANRRTIDRALAFAIQCVQSAIREAQLSDLALIKRNTLSPSSFSVDEVDHFSLPAFDDGPVPVRELGSNIKSGKQEITKTLVLVSKLNPHIPRIWYALAQPGVRAVASTEFVCLQARGDATAEELWACCSTREFTEQLQERVTGTTGSHQRVRPEDMMTVTIADPTTLPETTRSALREAVALGEALRHETPSLAALRDALLPTLMSGELRVRDAEHLVEDAV